ncbi:MAG: hypothetical protein LIO93_07895, partial [Bacteroidales bacterium]|nr:hypothetical protein [Bacteroidales bacterium]
VKDMKPDNREYPIYNYSDIFSKYFFQKDTDNLRNCPEHVLIFVFSGELTVYYHDLTVTVGKGEYIFLRKDVNTLLVRKSLKNEPFRSVFMGLSISFLREFYRNMNKNKMPETNEKFQKNVIELTKNPYLDSIYISMLPYLKDNLKPMQPILEIKMMEAVLGLLLLDERFYPCLFDCCKLWKDDIMKFLNQNYTSMVRLGENEGASHSLWIISKKLETAYTKMQQGEKVADIYIEVSYKDVVRFIKAFERQYGFSPLN